jgi:hypothetical protein
VHHGTYQRGVWRGARSERGPPFERERVRSAWVRVGFDRVGLQTRDGHAPGIDNPAAPRQAKSRYSPSHGECDTRPFFGEEIVLRGRGPPHLCVPCGARYVRSPRACAAAAVRFSMPSLARMLWTCCLARQLRRGRRQSGRRIVAVLQIISLTSGNAVGIAGGCRPSRQPRWPRRASPGRALPTSRASGGRFRRLDGPPARLTRSPSGRPKSPKPRRRRRTWSDRAARAATPKPGSANPW